MSTSKRIIKNTFFVSVQQMLMQVVGVFVLGYLASVIGVEQYGIFIFSLSFVSIFGMIANLGTRTYATKEIAANKHDASRIFSEILPLRLILSLLASLATVATVHILPYTENIVLLVEIAAFSQLCSYLYTSTFIVYEAFEMMAFPVTIDIAIRIFVLAGSVAAVLHGYGVVGLAISYAVGNLIEIFVAFYFLQKRLFKIRFNIFPFCLKKNINLIKLSLPFCFIGIFSILLSELDKIMLSLMNGPVSVGLYGAAFTLSNRIAGIVDALSTAFFPVIIRLKNEISSVIFRDRITESLQGLFILTAPIAFGVFTLSDDIIGLVYHNKSFFPAALALKILIIGLPIEAMSFIFVFSLLGEGRQIVLVKLNAGILLVNLLLNYYFISLWSYTGAAIVTSTSIILKLICLLLLSGEIVCWKKFIRTVVWTAVIGGLMSLLVAWIKDFTLVGAILGGAFFYITMIILTKPIDLTRYVNMLKCRNEN